MKKSIGYEGFGFCPQESLHHFVVTIPRGKQQDVIISEHFSFDPKKGSAPVNVSNDPTSYDGQVKVHLNRVKWDAIADALRVEFNRRLSAHNIKTGRWKLGTNCLARLLGKELVLLAWAIEDADPATIPAAIRNWQGLAQEERWWLYSMTNAATGHFKLGKNKGWRKAVRFALTENPVGDQQRVGDAERLVLTPVIA